MTRRSAFATLCVLNVLVLAAAGCGSTTSKGTVSGKVTHKNKPVVWGTVTLIASDNKAYTGEITPEGTYSIPDVPGGPVKLCVTSPNPDAGKQRGGAGRGGAGDVEAGGGAAGVSLPKGAWFLIPEKYADPQRSGLTGTVHNDTTIDLKLD
jgi:hypothetical protein